MLPSRRILSLFSPKFGQSFSKTLTCSRFISNKSEPSSIYDFTAKDIKGNDVSLSKYQNKVCLIVNVASEWDVTEINYSQLVELHNTYSDKGLCILAFPCNQFGLQEPGTNEEIEQFVKEKFNVQFDLFAKVDVNGKEAIPLFKYLRHHKNTKGYFFNNIKWNFTKFLVDRNGQPRKRYKTSRTPKSLENAIKKLL